MAGNGERANDDERYEYNDSDNDDKTEGGVQDITTTKPRGRREVECIKLSAMRKKELHNELCHYE